MKRNPEELADVVFDILVEHCGAIEDQRNNFVHEVTHSCREYRCCRDLGFGGKFYPEIMRVDYYSEDRTANRELIQARVNRKLSELILAEDDKQ